MLDFARSLAPASIVRYVTWKLTGKSRPLRLRTRSGAQFFLRSDTSENNDYGVAYEVFVHDYYKLPPEVNARDVRLVVDLGANVGMSVLFWLAHLPHCRVEAYEPHPGHVKQIRSNLTLSGQQDRVSVYPQAAGAWARKAQFASLGASTSPSTSSPTTSSGRSFDADIVDIFDRLAGRRVDLLKVDVEGAEYELLDDPRFARLDLGAVVMEWHGRGDGTADRKWCEARLTSMGFVIRPVQVTPNYGVFWAVREASGGAAQRLQLP